MCAVVAWSLSLPAPVGLEERTWEAPVRGWGLHGRQRGWDEAGVLGSRGFAPSR